MKNGIPRILVVRLGAIGDVVRVLPSLHALRAGFPSAQIDWAVETKSKDIVEGHPDLDSVHVFDRSPVLSESIGNFLRFCRTIKRSRYDIVVDFHGVFKSGAILWASGAPDRYGFAAPRARELSHLVTNRKKKLSGDLLNRVEENLQLCELLAPRPGAVEFALHVSDEIHSEIDGYFEETFGAGKLVVAMHVPMDRHEKRWPHANFAGLADLLLADGRFEVVMTWGPGQLDDVHKVLAESRRHPYVAPEMADLKHYMGLISRADLYFGCDTGPMHIAYAMGTPVVVLFGGTKPEQHGPVIGAVQTLTPESVNGNGLDVKGRKGNERMALITPEAAYDACVRAVSSPGPPSSEF